MGNLPRDLCVAVREVQQGWSAAFVRDGVVLGREQGKGLKPALNLVRARIAGETDTGGTGRESLPCAFADKVLGLAAFRLGRLLGAQLMWGEMASELAVVEGRRAGVDVRYHLLIPAVMDQKMQSLCPMEHLAFRSGSDYRFYLDLTALIR